MGKVSQFVQTLKHKDKLLLQILHSSIMSGSMILSKMQSTVAGQIFNLKSIKFTWINKICNKINFKSNF